MLASHWSIFFIGIMTCFSSILFLIELQISYATNICTHCMNFFLKNEQMIRFDREYAKLISLPLNDISTILWGHSSMVFHCE